MNRSARVLCTAFLLGSAAVATARADEVKIRVMDAGGAPIPNAKVWISTLQGYEPAAVYSTNAGGALTADVTIEPEFGKLTARVTAWAPGWAVGGGVVKAGAAEIRLEKPRPLSGVVNDADGRPVEGALVRPVFLVKPDNDFAAIAMVGDTPEWADLFVKTDAAGRWTLPFMPQAGHATYGLCDTRFARATNEITLAANAETKPLVARPAATLEGRVLGIDGKPVFRAVVVAWDAKVGAGYAKTDENGTYRVDRLGGGSYTLRLYRQKGGYPAAPLEPVTVKEGETVHAPDMTLVAGVPVEGVVTAAVTGAPLAGAMVSVAQTYATTGADGRFSARVLPGQAQLYVVAVPEGYSYPVAGGPSSPMSLKVPAEGIRDLSFKLPVAPVLAGRLVDEAGAAPTGITFFAWQKWQKTDVDVAADGSFRIKTLAPGPVGFGVEGDWALVDTPTITLPQTTPLTVRVRHAVLPTLSGRAVDTTGKPIEGVNVQIDSGGRTSNDGTDGTPSRSYMLATGPDGRYRVPKIRPENTFVISAKKAGYRYRTGGTVTSNKEILGVTGAMIPNPNPTFSVDDIVLQELSQTLDGVVRDAAGAPVADAEVFASGGESTAHSDGEGHFHISGLPPGDDTVFAAKGKLFAKARSKEGTVTDLVLQPVVPGSPVEGGRALVKELGAGGEQSYYAENAIASLARIDPDAALVLVSSLKADRQSRAGAMALLAFVNADPAKARGRIPDLLGALPKPLSGFEGLQLANEIVAYEPEEARAIYDREKAQLKPATAGLGTDYQALMTRVGLGTLGITLKIEGAEALITEAFAAAGKVDKNQSYYLDLLAARIALGGGALVERVISQLPADRRPSAMARAVAGLAKRDLPEAVRLLNTIPEMADTTDNRDPSWQREFAFGNAATAVIAQLGKTDPAAALALARRITNENYRGKALALAATFQPKETALSLLREALAKAPPGELFRVTLAMRATSIDAKFADELLAECEKRLLDAGASYGYDRDQALGQLAFTLASSQPGHARLVLEREADKEGKKEVWLRTPGLIAMARIDFQRAVELSQIFVARDSDAKNAWSGPYLTSMLAQYALTPEPLRSTTSINRLINSNNDYWNEADG